jgi:hypothetical protein
VGARVRHEETLRQPQRQVGAHLVEALQRRGARLRHLTSVSRRGEIAQAEARIIVAWPDDAVEVNFLQCHDVSA